jgi:hypothetical protein
VAPGSALALDPRRSALAWARTRARGWRGKHRWTTYGLPAVALAIGGYLIPADPTRRESIAYPILGLLLGGLLGATSSLGLALLLAPYEQRNALRASAGPITVTAKAADLTGNREQWMLSATFTSSRSGQYRVSLPYRSGWLFVPTPRGCAHLLNPMADPADDPAVFTLRKNVPQTVDLAALSLRHGNKASVRATPMWDPPEKMFGRPLDVLDTYFRGGQGGAGEIGSPAASQTSAGDARHPPTSGLA